MAITDPQPSPPSTSVVPEDIFANPEEALARIDALNEQYERGELVVYSHEEVCRRLGIAPGPPFSVDE